VTSNTIVKEIWKREDCRDYGLIGGVVAYRVGDYKRLGRRRIRRLG
jgi:hypothetical protein